MTQTATDTLIKVHGLGLARLSADGEEDLVTDLSFEISRGSTLALVGESGSGKSLSALACMGLLPSGVYRKAGHIDLFGRDAADFTSSDWRSLRGARIGMIFQDPMTSLDPCFRVGPQIVEAIRAHEQVSKSDAKAMAIDLLDQVRVAHPETRYHAYPHELSGGLRQRVMIAAALALRPDVLIADEPTTALDVTTQAAIVDLVDELRRELNIGVMWISHDLGVVGQIADRVAVLYAGEIAELATTHAIFQAPRHPYTVGLIESARVRGPGLPFGLIKGNVPEPGHWPTGCRFAPRCPAAQAACESHPDLVTSEAHSVRCYFPGEVKVS